MTTVALDLVPEDDDPRQYLPFVQVEVDGEGVTAILDTGAGTTQLVDRPGFVVEAATPTPSQSASGGALSSVGTTRVTCQIGDTTARPVRVHLVDRARSPRSNLLGLDVVGQFRCLYRLSDGELVLDPAPPATTQPVELGRNGHVYMQATWPGSSTAAPAAGAGVFDTGASVTVVGRHFADEHPHLFTADGRQTGTDASGNSVEAALATMQGPTILGHPLNDALVAIVDLDAINSAIDIPMDLILGWSLLSQADWYIDHLDGGAACLARTGR